MYLYDTLPRTTVSRRRVGGPSPRVGFSAGFSASRSLVRSPAARAATAAAESLLSEIVQDVGSKSISVIPELVAAAKGGTWFQPLLVSAGTLSLNESALAIIPLLLATFLSKLTVKSKSLFTRLIDGVVLVPLKSTVPSILCARILVIWFSTLHIVLQRLRPVIFGYNAIGDVSYRFAQALEATYESLWIVLTARMVLGAKDVLLTEYALHALEGRRESNTIGLTRFVNSVKWALSLLCWAVATFKILVDAWGFNVVPLLSSLTASSLIIGLAAQPLLSNVIAGLAVFSSRQVVPGDHVQLLTGGGAVAIDGHVEVIGPTTTIIRDCEDSLVYVNNKTLSEMILRNKSQAVVAQK